MITNTLNHYEISTAYSADEVMSIYRRNKLLNFADVATNNGDLRNLNQMIDLGSKKLTTVMGPQQEGKIIDRPT